jgi:O-antigen/teichoic acid export membrane protein
MAAELGKYSAGLTLWSFSMFLVTGLQVTIVGHFDFGAVGYYSIGASLITFIAGVDGAICNALMTPVAALHASGQADRIRTLILGATRLNSFLNVLAALFIFQWGSLVLRLWVGSRYAGPALPIAELLMIANALRLIGGPYAAMLIATNQQKHGIAQGMVEGVTNLSASVVGVVWLGTIGVALGTLIGAICALAWLCVLTLRYATEIPLGRWSFVKEGFFRPVACSLPLILFIAVKYHRPLVPRSALILAWCAVVTCLLTYSFGKVLPASFRLRNLLSKYA